MSVPVPVVLPPLRDNHYKEGESVKTFSFMGHDFEIALCGDLWDVTWDKFVTKAIVLWPVYVSFTLEEWTQEDSSMKQLSIFWVNVFISFVFILKKSGAGSPRRVDGPGPIGQPISVP